MSSNWHRQDVEQVEVKPAKMIVSLALAQGLAYNCATRMWIYRGFPVDKK